MTTPSVTGVTTEIRKLTDFLVSSGFVDDQNYPILREVAPGLKEVIFPGLPDMSSVLKNVTYAELYHDQLARRSFNFRMLDGALIQMSYRFEGGAVFQGRLAFLPSPDMEAFQNDPELFEDDLLFAEVISKRIFPSPLRFDFDMRPAVAVDLDHPRSHLTLGQYKNCRIAVTAPVTPGVFIGFILRSFYNPALKALESPAPCFGHRFTDTISAAESANVHLAIP